MDTIFALATPRGRSGVAVIRISGPAALEAASALMTSVPESRGLRSLRDGEGGLLDQALVLRFDAGRSFTGEDVVELHTHGSPAILTAVLRVLSTLPGLRPAEAGEFTRRALENGRLDLAEVEGLADLIDAETEAQRRQAVRVFAGGLSALAEQWRADLIEAAMLLEATIDFVDEAVPVDVYPRVGQLLHQTQASLQREVDGVGAAERIRDGFEVAIVGAPNVGKSTLLNRLAGREAAITSDVAGTTRDVIEVRMDIGGYAVTFLDTAGIRETRDVVEGIGVDRATSRAAEADLRVVLLDEGQESPMPLEAGDIVLRAKADRVPEDEDGISGKTGAGVDRLVNRIATVLGGRMQGSGLAIRERHRLALGAALSHIGEAQAQILAGASADLVAADLALAVRSVESITGRIDVEDLLDRIFSSFCIGK